MIPAGRQLRACSEGGEVSFVRLRIKRGQALCRHGHHFGKRDPFILYHARGLSGATRLVLLRVPASRETVVQGIGMGNPVVTPLSLVFVPHLRQQVDP